MKTIKKTKKASSFPWISFWILVIVWPTTIGFNYAYAYFVEPSYDTFSFAMVACMGSLINFMAALVRNGGNKSSRGIPNEDNHYAPGYLDSRAINSSKVDPGNQTMDPFDPFDNN